MRGGIHLTTATVATELKAYLKSFIDKAIDGESIIITRPKSKNAVLISEEEYNELLRIKNNSQYLFKLNQSIKQAENGKIVVKTMEELEAMEYE